MLDIAAAREGFRESHLRNWLPSKSCMLKACRGAAMKILLALLRGARAYYIHKDDMILLGILLRSL